ncbi:helix-turn-helix domain-containing protein [Exiguobacterium sp. S22-S28]
MYEANMTVEDITRTLNISRATFYKYKKQAEQRK